MDVTKIKTMVDNAHKVVGAIRTEIQAATTAAIKAGEKNPLEFNGLQALGAANLELDNVTDRLGRVSEKIEKAVEKTTPKVKKEKEDKAGKTAKK